jgi:hypothetical protein
MHGERIEIEFDGQVYIVYPNSRNKNLASYFRCFKRKLGVDYLHRKVWEKDNGKIPDGYDVHHKDEDTFNNDIYNLELISKKDHIEKHREAMVKNGKGHVNSGHLERIRLMTKVWHGSEEGLLWHKEHANKIFSKEARNKVKMVCELCESEYLSDEFRAKTASRFCSNKCKSESRRRSGVDNVKSDCEICKTSFTRNKYAKQVVCSRGCAGELRKRRRCLRLNG